MPMHHERWAEASSDRMRPRRSATSALPSAPARNPSEQPLCIEVTGLTKRFPRVTAVDGLSFEVRSGEIFGFLGPNGAGKTTTINLLIGLARADAGTIRIHGLETTRRPKSIQHLIGVVPDESNLYPELSGRDNLTFCAALYGMGLSARRARAAELLESFGLAEAAGRKFATYCCRAWWRSLSYSAPLPCWP